MRQLLGSAKQRLSRGVRVAVLASTFLGAVTPALAEDAVVEALIQRGIQLRRDSSDEEALAVFLEAEKQDPTSVRVLLHVVTAAQAAGKWLVADAYMKKVSALSDDAYYRRHADAIDVVRRAVTARVGSFQAQGEPDGASVRLDGQLVGTLPMKEPTSIEAGAYLMEVHKPGFYRLRRNVTITGGVLTREPVELNRAVVRSDVGAGAGVADGSLGGDGGEPSWVESPVLGWSLVGAGVVSGVVSGVAFMAQKNSAERWNDDGRCVPNNGQTREDNCGSDRSSAESAETLGVITAVAGVALAGAGIVQLVLSDGGRPERTPADEAGVKISQCSPGILGIVCQGSF